MKHLLLAALALLTLSCNRHSKYENLRDRPLPVEIEVVGHSSQMVANSYVGEIEAEVSIPLVFPLGGQITSIQVASGQKVQQGDIIATIDDTQAKALKESADALLSQAQDGYQRLKMVHEKGGISDVKWVEMETNLQKAQSMAISAAKRFEDCTLRAPKTGLVNLNDVQVGQQLTLAQPIGKLINLSSMQASFTVPESEIGQILHADTLQILIPALNLTYNAKVAQKSLLATQLAHTFKVTAIIDDKKAGEVLLPGMVCRAIICSKDMEGFIISAGCVQTQQNGHSVWVLRNGRTQRVMVTIADFVENGVLVSEGLQLGDTVIAKGYQKMFNGARVSF